MEKPAVIFSEAGLKIFLDFVKGIQQKDNPVDNLVKDYFARTDRPDISGKVEEVSTDTKYDMDEVTQVISDALHERSGYNMSTDEIHEELEMHGITYPKRSIAPVMKGVMNRVPEIKRVDVGVYVYEPEVTDIDEA